MVKQMTFSAIGGITFINIIDIYTIQRDIQERDHPARPLLAMLLEEQTAFSLSSFTRSPTTFAPPTKMIQSLGAQLRQMKMTIIFRALVPGVTVTLPAQIKV